MKRNVFLTVTLAIVLAFGMAVIGCDDGSGNGKEPGNTGTPEEMEYTSIGNDGNKYQLIITKNPDEKQPRAFTPSGGDAYVLLIIRISDNTLLATSSGTVSSASGGTLTLKSGEAEFSVTISSSGTMTAITVSGGGSIPGTEVAAPGAGMTAGGGGNGNDTNPLVGRWGYEFTRAEYAQEEGVSDATLAAAGIPATWFFGFEFKADMTLTLYEVGPSAGSDGNNVWYEWDPDIWPGTYTISGNTVTMLFIYEDGDSDTWTATFSGDTLTCMGSPFPKM